MKLVWGRALLIAALGALTLVVLTGRASSTAVGVQTLAVACPASLVTGGHDYHGLTLTMCNFSGLDLSGANFNGATLTAVVFIRTKLTGADFSGATIAASGNLVFSTDFTLADLTEAKFIRAQFNAPTYFTYATLTCTDFSNTTLADGNAIFGDSALRFDTSACRPKFAGAVMGCEFFAQWPKLDMSQADITACRPLVMPGQDFSGAMLNGVVFDRLDLTNTRWAGAMLEHASFQGATLDNATGLNGTEAVPSHLAATKFNNASMRNVDMSHAQLYGANFTHADLSGAKLFGAFLISNVSAVPPIEGAAVFDGAHMKNVNLATAKLAGASFKYASFYSSFAGGTPSFPCKTDDCATASGADLTDANFSNAFLFGVDFTGSKTSINGTQFGSAILVGASFNNAKFSANGGVPPEFTSAMLSGTQFGATANLAGATMTGAFVDFGASTNQNVGNVLYVVLSADYTRFRDWEGSEKPCVQLPYAKFSSLPAAAPLTCPNGLSMACGTGRPGPPPRGNPNWYGGIQIGTNTPVPGWYAADATYDTAPVSAPCSSSNVDSKW